MGEGVHCAINSHHLVDVLSLSPFIHPPPSRISHLRFIVLAFSMQLTMAMSFVGSPISIILRVNTSGLEVDLKKPVSDPPLIAKRGINRSGMKKEGAGWSRST